MKKLWFYILVNIFFIISLTASAMAYGGGGDDVTTSVDTTSNMAPSYFAPITLSPPVKDNVFVMDPPTQDTSSVDPTEITILSEDGIGYATAVLIAEVMKDPNVQWVAITAGGILVGYATAGAGLPVYAQAVAAGTFAAATTYATRSGQPGQAASTAYSGVKDLAVGFIPVPPPVQAGFSIAIDKTIDLVSQAPGLNSSGHGSGGYAQTYSH